MKHYDRTFVMHHDQSSRTFVSFRDPSDVVDPGHQDPLAPELAEKAAEAASSLGAEACRAEFHMGVSWVYFNREIPQPMGVWMVWAYVPFLPGESLGGRDLF